MCYSGKSIQTKYYYYFRNNNNGRHISYKVMNSFAVYGTFSIFEDENCIDLGLERNRYSSTYIYYRGSPHFTQFHFTCF